MKIQRIEIKKLYGSFSRSIDLDKKLTLLVGINGSGKTSILNCIDWMLRPDLARLAATRFDSIRLFCSHMGKSYILQARQNESQLIYSEEANAGEYTPVTVDFTRSPSAIHSEQDFQEACRSYKELTPEPHERKLWKLMHELPNPLTITLDRSIAAEVDDAIFLETASRVRIHKSPTKSPLFKVIDVTRKRYAMYLERISKLNDDLKTKIVLSAFKDPFSATRSIEKKVSHAEISKLESKVTSLLYATMTAEQAAASNVVNYFKSAKLLATQVGDDESFRYVFWTQFRQIHELAAAFDEYERKASAAYDALGSYLDVINTFFKDSNKAIGFGDHDGSLGFQFLSNKKVPTGPHRSLDRLSSGERQILILLTFLAFVASKDEVFIVDEPELSLHPKWQQLFLKAVLSQAPVDTQIVLATHAPEIVANHRANCIVLEA